MNAEPEIPESRELLFHHFRTEITALEREALKDFRPYPHKPARRTS